LNAAVAYILSASIEFETLIVSGAQNTFTLIMELAFYHKILTIRKCAFKVAGKFAPMIIRNG